MLLVALDVTSAPVVTITHSSCFAVTFLTIPCRPIMTSTGPQRESRPVGRLTQGLRSALILHPITRMHACKMTACHRHLGYVCNMAT